MFPVSATIAEIDAARQPGPLVERLADASRLAGRFAHDFDNVLMGVMGYAELAQASVAQESDTYGLLAELLRVANKGRAATRQLHRFSQSGRPSRGASNLAATWRAELAELGETRPAAAFVQCAFPDDLPDIALPPDAVRAVIGAIVANALDAVGDCGNVRASAKPYRVDAMVDSLPEALQPGSYVALAVTDDGRGFAPDILLQVAESPYLTTTVRHRGLGLSTALLGLATHGGGLRIAPATPKGTTVTVFLPTDRTDPER